MEKRLTIKSKMGARALEHPTSRHILLEIVDKECSLGELRQTLNLSLSLLTYHVNRLRRAGLIRITQRISRSGRPIKRYRAVAKEFFVPAAIASSSATHALAEELRRTLEHERLTRNGAGTLYLIDDRGRRLIRPVGGEPVGSAFEAWIITELSVQDAERFGNELKLMISKFATPRAGKKRSFLLHCALAPRPAI